MNENIEVCNDYDCTFSNLCHNGQCFCETNNFLGRIESCSCLIHTLKNVPLKEIRKTIKETKHLPGSERLQAVIKLYKKCFVH